jgi:DNA-binding PadR family transcriptional regulator
MSRRSELTAGEWAVLALLTEGPSHGFALARAMAPEGEVGRIWSVRRPLVYRAIETLTRLELVRPAGTVASRTGPQRTVLEATPNGKRSVTRWLKTPVEHVRDARSLLMLKLLFLTRRGADLAPLLTAQRALLAGIAERLMMAADAGEGFDRALLRWRLESTTAVIRFVDTMLRESARAARQ